MAERKATTVGVRLLLGGMSLIVIGFLLFSIGLNPVAASNLPALTVEDCGKCHLVPLKNISVAGGKHARDLNCLACHPAHPPTEEEVVLPCTECHNQTAHEQLTGCTHCHTDGHRPLASLRDPLKPAKQECLSCHQHVGQQMSTEPSRHAELFCNRCHSRHKEIPGCLDCHKPHQQNQAAEGCQQCHPAHQPLLVAPSGHLPSNACRACHVQEANDLATTTTLHGGINCLYCHKGRHPSIPSCQDCHGLPHTQAIHGKYRDCLECHGDAHNLINN